MSGDHVEVEEVNLSKLNLIKPPRHSSSAKSAKSSTKSAGTKASRPGPLGSAQFRQYQPPSYRSYVADDMPTPKSERWTIRLKGKAGAEGGYLSEKTQRLNTHLGLMFEDERGTAAQHPKSFMTQMDKDGSDDEDLDPDIDVAALNQSAINELFDHLNLARELSSADINIQFTEAVTNHDRRHKRLSLPPLSKSWTKSRQRRPITKRNEFEVPETMEEVKKLLQLLPADLEQQIRAARRETHLLERNRTVADNWCQIHRTQHRKHVRQARQRQHKAIERHQAYEADFVNATSRLLERKFLTSQKLLQAQNDPDYKIRVNTWGAGVIAAIWQSTVTARFLANSAELKMKQKWQWAAQVLRRKLLIIFRAYKKRQVDKAFPEGSRRRAIMIQYIRMRSQEQRDEAATFLVLFLSKCRIAYRLYSIRAAFKLRMIRIQKWWKMLSAQKKAQHFIIVRQFLDLEAKVIMRRDMHFFKDVKLLIAVKEQIMHIQGTLEMDSRKLKKKKWPFANNRAEALRDTTVDILRTPSLKALGYKELVMTKRCSTHVLAENEAHEMAEEPFKLLLTKLGIYHCLVPTTEGARNRLITEQLKSMKLQRWAARKEYERKVRDGVVVREPAPLPLVIPKVQLLALVQKGLQMSNKHLQISGDPLIYAGCL
uniref:Uncharacterized protein n=1 Tax=Eutreptiella gymnastica TaxID=73025 RepID=A0A7S1N349_9EUGL|mmetsp:Transcript_11340/g.20429  ORF Transcript_11340/g.20429 Transcript_11340/m.20429 type:complete len:655 (+) Transcript_11340:201-2165(+)